MIRYTIMATAIFLCSMTLTYPASAQDQILYSLDGDSAADAFGISVSGVGDINNDGFDDFIIGALTSSNGANSGSAYVFSGKDGSRLYTFNGDEEDRLGVSVSGAGDVNNDGVNDVIVGAPGDDNGGMDFGSAHVFSGSDGSTLYTFNGDKSNGRFGNEVSGAGDVNNDGFDDLIVGAFFDDNNGALSGSAQVFSGKDGSTLFTLAGAAGDLFGFTVSDVGDVNGDGFDDFAVGASEDNGYVRVYSGQDASTLYTFNGDSPGDSFSNVSGAGDVNNDGFDDIIVGAPTDDNNGTDSGSATVFSGQDGSTLFSFNGDAADDGFGGVSGAGDVNGDGFDDFIISAQGATPNGAVSGMARVYSGKDGSVLSTINGDAEFDNLGNSVSGAGDVNNDGFPDIIVGIFQDGNNGMNSGSARVIALDQCSDDSSKLVPGDCGCGNSDADSNGNGVADCLDPTAETIPTKPELSKKKRTITVTMQEFPGAVTYHVFARGRKKGDGKAKGKGKGKKRIKRSKNVTTNVAVFKRFPPGRHKFFYNVSERRRNYHVVRPGIVASPCSPLPA